MGGREVGVKPVGRGHSGGEVSIGGREVRDFGWQLNQLVRGHPGGGRLGCSGGSS